ncbi:MAG: porin [Rhodobacterales bacterium]|nr:porin [Rhodobacterales bacterium]
MKKILFATTALVATAGVAAADVSFGGYGRFGVAYTSAGAGSTDLTSRLRLTITGTTESDNGLSFGARYRIQQSGTSAAPAATGTGTNQARFWMSAGGLTVAVGNIFGAMDSLPNLYIGQHGGSIGYQGLGYGHVVTEFATHTYSSGSAGSAGSDGVEVTYSGDAYSVHLSSGASRIEFGGSYSFGDWTVGAAATDAGAGAQWVATVGGTIGSINIRAAVAEVGVNTNYNVSAGFAVGAATTITAYLASVRGADNYGLGVNHSLGGGASIAAGVASLGGTTRAEAGVVFNF